MSDSISYETEGRKAGPTYDFTTTHWSVVLSAATPDQPQSQEAWEKLALAYWFPLYAFIRRSGHQPHDAHDLAQGFFVQLMQREVLVGIVEGEGRFRSYLLVCLKRYLADQRRHAHAARRRPPAGWLYLDEGTAEGRYQAELVDRATPEELFGRECATVLLDKALTRLEAYYTGQGRKPLLDCLLAHLMRDPSAVPHRALGEQLGISESAVKSEMYRLRQRFRLVFREEVAATVPPNEIEQEMRYIVQALSH